MPNFDAQPAVFAVGMESTEGPAFDRRGNLVVCDMARRQVYRINPQGEVTPFIDTTTDAGAQPTGAKFHHDGRLFVCDLIPPRNPVGRLRRVVRPALQTHQGARLHGPTTWSSHRMATCTSPIRARATWSTPMVTSICGERGAPWSAWPAASPCATASRWRTTTRRYLSLRHIRSGFTATASMQPAGRWSIPRSPS